MVFSRLEPVRGVFSLRKVSSFSIFSSSSSSVLLRMGRQSSYVSSETMFGTATAMRGWIQGECKQPCRN